MDGDGPRQGQQMPPAQGDDSQSESQRSDIYGVAPGGGGNNPHRATGWHRHSSLSSQERGE
eukprot:905770-Lingulodinium_polyedra.AAC.1